MDSTEPDPIAERDQERAARRDELVALAEDSAAYRDQLLAHGFDRRETIEMILHWQELRWEEC